VHHQGHQGPRRGLRGGGRVPRTMA
jgi:hypothetical protein